PLPPPNLPPPGPPARKPPVGVIVGVAAGGLALVLCLCGIGTGVALTAGARGGKKPATAPAEPAAPSESLPPAEPPPEPLPPTEPLPPPGQPPSGAPGATPAPKAVLPDVVGKRLTDAVAVLAASGFTDIRPADATGAERFVLNPNNWLVRSQAPPGGARVAVSAPVTLNVSKPSDGQPTGPVTVGVVPDVVCRDLQSAQELLRTAGFANLASRDGTGAGRAQLVDQNWLVIAQSAAAGSRPDPGRKITLTVVKYGESTGGSGCRS
ncbi:MAG TPA: PASTA domain-containing protein, partial [Streptosporangiaceae bacterium]